MAISGDVREIRFQLNIKLATELHGGFYDYSLCTPINTGELTTIICPIHGEFRQTMKMHKRGRGCIKCGVLKSSSKRKRDTTWFKKQAKVVHGELYDYSISKYTGITDKIDIICPHHGIFTTTPNIHINSKSKCPDCANSVRVGILQVDNPLLNKSSFIEKANKHFEEGLYNYDQVIINGSTGKINIGCNKCGKYFNIRAINHYYYGWGCRSCNPINKHSEGELEVMEFVKKIENKEMKKHLVESGNTTILGGKELDIYIPDQKVAIEFNGLYWHSERKGKDRKYHLNKTERCEENGIRLIHIFDFEWAQKPTIVKSLISKALNGGDGEILYARKLDIKVVSIKDSRAFLDEFHIQGYVGASIRYGLYRGEELVSLMTFGKSRFSKHQWELVRYVVRGDLKIVGGSKRLFKKFIKHHHPTSITTYSDRRLFTGGMYSDLGFTFKHNSPPNYFYFKSKESGRPDMVKLESRNKYQKHKLKNLLEKFDPEMTEVQNMFNNGFDRVWDCGNKVWEWKNE